MGDLCGLKEIVGCQTKLDALLFRPCLSWLMIQELVSLSTKTDLRGRNQWLRIFFSLTKLIYFCEFL